MDATERALGTLALLSDYFFHLAIGRLNGLTNGLVEGEAAGALADLLAECHEVLTDDINGVTREVAHE